MTDPALVSAQPWMHTDARAGMIDRALVATGTIGGSRVRVLPEPLLTERAGAPVQAIRLLFDDAETASRATDPVLSSDGGHVLVDVADAPDESSVRVLVHRVEEPTRVELAIAGLGAGSLTFTLLPQREWSIHVVHHSHFDFGYTDPQSTVIAQQRSYLDSAIELARRTADWPEESRFRWNVEALWAFSDWERHRPAADVAEFVRLVQDGSIGLSAMPYNLHTDTCSTEELHELLREARSISARHGIDFTTAMQTDVPGQVAGLPDALHSIGVEYLAVAHNWAGRSMPHTNGGVDLPRMFRWRTPAGGSVIVWMTDSPHGLAYLEGPMVGLTESYEVVDELLPAYLTSLATKGWPFPPGVFGAHGEDVEGRPAYPGDVLHLRTQGFMGDNGPARLHLSEIVRRWNETWTSPKLRVSRNEDFFAEAEARHGDDLITIQGDWGDWWVEGVGSAAVPLALTREAQAAVTDARSFSQAAQWLGGEGVPAEREDAAAAYDAVSMFNEHTWGASNSWTHGDEGYESGERQWQWKVSHGLMAHQRGMDFTEHALVQLGSAVAPAGGALMSLVVANASGSVRSGVVRAIVKESTVPLEQLLQVRDGRTGEVLEAVVEEQSNSLHRESGRWVTVRVSDVPAFGFVRLDVHAAETQQAAPVVHPRSDVPLRELFTLENAFLRVEVDESSSAIRSIREKATGRELVDQESVVGFNAYVYDEYGSSGAGVNHLANKLWVSDRLELLASRDVGGAAVLVERVTDAVEERLVYEFAAKGVDRVRVTLRLRHDEPRLLIANRLTKPSTRTKESAYIAFPFRSESPVVRYEVSGGVTGDGMPHVPGAPQHMRAIRNWVTVTDGDDAVAWVTKDAPLVQTGAIALPYAPFPASTSPNQPSTVFSWLHNNLWDTNFPIEQGFTATFEYAVGVREHPGQRVEAVAMATTVDLVRPLIAVPARGRDGSREEASVGLLALDDERVQLVSVVADDRTGSSLVRLQSFADEVVRVGIALGSRPTSAVRTTFSGDLPTALPIDGDRVEIELQPFEVAAVRVTR